VSQFLRLTLPLKFLRVIFCMVPNMSLRQNINLKLGAAVVFFTMLSLVKIPKILFCTSNFVRRNNNKLYFNSDWSGNLYGIRSLDLVPFPCLKCFLGRNSGLDKFQF